MKEMRYESVTASCTCLVPGIDSMAGEDFSVVTDGSKFGLIHRDVRCGFVREEGLMPCNYDNLFFFKSGFYHAVVAVEAGKLGLFVPQGSSCTDGVYVEMRRLLPSVFDRFEPMRSIPGLVLCYMGNELSVYDMGEKRMSRSYIGIQELSDRYFLAWDGSEHVLCNRENFREAYRMDNDVLCTFAGKWACGDVYMLSDTSFCKRLLFCDRYGESLQLAPVAKDICLRGYYEDEKYSVTGITMKWGTEDEVVDSGVILGIMDTEER